MNAYDILCALERRHADDVFFSECKSGPSLNSTHARLDAWAMLRSWSPLTMLGYEIKVSRADWLRDQKLHTYLPLCHLLVICAPKGVVLPSEVPEGVGLQHALTSKAGVVRLSTVVKAPRRAIEPPTKLLLYLLMSRTAPTREHGSPHSPAEVQRIVGLAAVERQAGRALSTLISKELNDARAKIREQAGKAQELDDIAELVDRECKLRCVLAYSLADKVRRLLEPPAASQVEAARHQLARAAEGVKACAHYMDEARNQLAAAVRQ